MLSAASGQLWFYRWQLAADGFQASG